MTLPFTCMSSVTLHGHLAEHCDVQLQDPHAVWKSRDALWLAHHTASRQHYALETALLPTLAPDVFAGIQDTHGTRKHAQSLDSSNICTECLCYS
jgi:hypothetical protein